MSANGCVVKSQSRRRSPWPTRAFPLLIGIAAGEQERRNHQDDRDPHSRPPVRTADIIRLLRPPLWHRRTGQRPPTRRSLGFSPPASPRRSDRTSAPSRGMAYDGAPIHVFACDCALQGAHRHICRIVGFSGFCFLPAGCCRSVFQGEGHVLCVDDAPDCPYCVCIDPCGSVANIGAFRFSVHLQRDGCRRRMRQRNQHPGRFRDFRLQRLSCRRQLRWRPPGDLAGSGGGERKDRLLVLLAHAVAGSGHA